MFDSLSCRDVYKTILHLLRGSGVETADLDARLIIEKRAGVKHSDLISYPEKLIDNKAVGFIEEDVRARMSGRPLSRIYGERQFWGLDFWISDDTLDPRPDTELILDLALKRCDKNAPLRILDLGTGTGCIMLSLLHEFPQAQGVAADISRGALDVARRNAQRLGVAERVTFVESSWFDEIDGTYDLIVSNPPYIAPEVIPSLSRDVREHDPILALDGGESGLQPYKILFSSLSQFLKPNGIALFEIGYDQEPSILRLADDSGFVQRRVHMDLSANPRVVEILSGDK